MEENPIQEREFGPKGEGISRALRRKAELLSAVFSLPKPDITSTSVENMPEEFILPQEMAKVFREIVAKKDFSIIEYGTLGGINKKGRLFFDKLRRGSQKSVEMPWWYDLREEFGFREIHIHSHPTAIEVAGSTRFSPEDIASTFLTPQCEINIVIGREENFEAGYKILMSIQGRENIERAKIGRNQYQYYSYIVEKVNDICFRPISEIAEFFTRNNYALYVWSDYYVGIGNVSISSENIKVLKVKPFEFAEFEEDPRTKLMLPKT